MRCRWGLSAGLLDYTLARSQAVHALEDAFALATTIGDESLICDCAYTAADLLLNLGRPDQAERYINAIVRRDRWCSIILDLSLGDLALQRGDLARADDHLGAALAASRDLGNAFLLTLALNKAAILTDRRGHDSETTWLLLESMESSVATRIFWTLGFALLGLAAVATHLQRHDTAALLVGAASPYTGSAQFGIVSACRERAVGDLRDLRQALGARFDHAIAAGRALNLDEVMALARTLS